MIFTFLKTNKYLVLMFIVFLATVLRFWQIGGVPSSPDWDEVAHGYNAYSILHTGKDEYGNTLPFLLRSFGDFKPALYTYLIIPFIFLFDLSVIAVRLPSVLAGIIAIVAVYFLSEKLWKKTEISLLTALLLAISPWHIQFSRVAFEANIGVTCNILMVLFFFHSLKKPWLLTISAFFAGIGLYTYQSERLFIPLLVLAILVIYRNKIVIIPKKYIATALLCGSLISFSLVYSTFTDPHSLQRAKGTTFFSANSEMLQHSTKQLVRANKNNDIIGKIMYNRRVTYTKMMLSGYLSHFNVNWLFLKGDIPRHHAPNMGLLYLFELPFLLIGLYTLAFHPYFNHQTKGKMLVFIWLLLAPVPAAITNDVPHAVRTLNFLPIFQIITAIGIWFTFSFFAIYFRRKIYFFVIIILFLFLSGCNFLYYLDQYFNHMNYLYAKDWQYGYAQMLPEVIANKNNFSKIIVSSVTPMDQSYIFFLFYMKYSPPKYQVQMRDQRNSNERHFFDTFEFRKIDWNTDHDLHNTLFVGTLNDFPNGIYFNKVIKYPDGTSAMVLVSNK